MHKQVLLLNFFAENIPFISDIHFLKINKKIIFKYFNDDYLLPQAYKNNGDQQIISDKYYNKKKKKTF